MGHDKVRAISGARLRLDTRVLHQAEALARSAGVSVSELIELLLLGLLEADAEHVMPLPRRDREPQARVVPRKKAPARVIVMDDFRRRATAPPARSDAPEGRVLDVRSRASSLCRRAEQIRARSMRAREAARRARETARLALVELGRAMTPA